MTLPNETTFRALLENQGLTLSDERLAQAVAAHTALRPDVERLRAVPLAFVGDVVEPGTALQWIERGGVTG